MHRPIMPGLLVLATLSGCDNSMAPSDQSLAAARVHDRVSINVPFEEVAGSECLGEETLTIRGTLFEQFNSVSVPGDPVPYHYELTDVYRGIAVGSSGNIYKYVNTQHQTLSQPSLESIHWTFSFPAQILLIGTGAEPNRILHFTTHTTVLPSGELQVAIDEIRVTCQNR